MSDLTTKFGENAGKIWSALNEKGGLNKNKLIKVTQLNEEDFHTGVGWLARENKIAKDDEDCFKLDNTNLELEIGAHAGKIWKILDIWGDADFDTIKRLSDLDNNQVHSALGWLSREGKLIVDKNNRFNLK